MFGKRLGSLEGRMKIWLGEFSITSKKDHHHCAETHFSDEVNFASTGTFCSNDNLRWRSNSTAVSSSELYYFHSVASHRCMTEPLFASRGFNDMSHHPCVATPPTHNHPSTHSTPLPHPFPPGPVAVAVREGRRGVRGGSRGHQYAVLPQ